MKTRVNIIMLLKTAQTDCATFLFQGSALIGPDIIESQMLTGIVSQCCQVVYISEPCFMLT